MEDRLRRELEEAFQGRAHLYRLFFDELAQQFGPADAEAIMMRAIEKRGEEVGAAFFRQHGPSARKVGEAFLAVSPDGGRMYPHKADRHEDGIDIMVDRCPLKDAWTGAGLPPDRVATLCRIAGAFDKGLFEAAGVKFTNETWTEQRGGGCCHIFLRDGD
jgi:hypothetical protein